MIVVAAITAASMIFILLIYLEVMLLNRKG